MATNTSTATPQQASNVEIQAWATFMDTCIQTTAGWYYVSQSGDANPTTISFTGSISTPVGFRCYKMTDTLGGATSSVGAAPIYLKLEWGSGTTATFPAIWVTAGTSLNGSGTVGGTLVNRITIFGGAASATGYTSYFSGNTNYLVFAMWAGDTVNTVSAANATHMIHFFLERTKDNNGNDTSSGVYFGCSGGSSPNQYSNYASLVTNSIPTVEAYMRAALNNTNSTMNMGATGGVAVPIFFSPAPQNPGLSVFGGWAADNALYSQIPVTIYGTQHNCIWLPLGCSVVNNNIGTGIVCMRYE